MARKQEDATYIRKWIKKGLKRDGKTLDFSGRTINYETALDLADTIELEGVEIFFLHECQLKDDALEELADADFLNSLKELWLYKNKIRDEGAKALGFSSQLGQLGTKIVVQGRERGTESHRSRDRPSTVSDRLQTQTRRFTRDWPAAGGRAPAASSGTAGTETMGPPNY